MKYRFSFLAAAILLGSAFSANAQNLITNGDFTAGNSGFGSDYSFTSTLTAHENMYGVTTNPKNLHADWIASTDILPCAGGNCGGDMLIANGGQIANTVWHQTVTVLPSRRYEFIAWVTSVLSNDPNPASMTIDVDLTSACTGTPLTNTFATKIGDINAVSAAGTWIKNTSTTFTTGASTSICLRIANNNLTAHGNDFALDDLSLTLLATAAPTAANDTTSTVVDTPVTVAVLANDSAVAPATLAATAATVDLDPGTAGVQNTLTATNQGTFTVNADGTVTFTPVAGYTGSVTVPYQVIDSTNTVSATALIVITVTPAVPITPGTGVTAVPTLSSIGLMVLSLALGAGALAQRRRRSRQD